VGTRGWHLVMATAWVACGFGPQEDLGGLRAGDGVAPWSDLGSAEICLGNEHLGPPASAPAGLCAPTAVVEAPCVDDGDCRSREACVCGQCIVPTCTSASDCGPGRVCTFGEQRCDRTCGRDDDCPIGDICFNGTCRGQCIGDADCQTGEVCSLARNRCITAACADDGDCMAGERCRVQRVPRLVTEPTALAGAGPGEPAVTLWLELGDALQPDQRSIWRAVSSDGVHFTVAPARAVLEDGGAARAPSVIRTATGFALYYQRGDGAAIGYAASTDGQSFASPTTVVTGGTGGAAVRAPSAVLMPDGQVALYYEVGDGAGVALARGAVGAPLSGSVVLDAGDVEDPPGPGTAPQFWVDIAAVRSPSAALTRSDAGESLRLWFSGFGRESGDSVQFGDVVPIPPNDSIGYAAASLDDPGRLWPWPFNPVFDRVQAFVDHRSELAPAVVQLTDRDGSPRTGYLLYFVDAEPGDATGPGVLGRLGVASNGDFQNPSAAN